MFFFFSASGPPVIALIHSVRMLHLKILIQHAKMKPQLLSHRTFFHKLTMLGKCLSSLEKLLFPNMFWNSDMYTHTHTHTPQCKTKSEMKWLYLIRKSENNFPWFLFTYIMWFLEEWDLNYYDLFSIRVQSFAFYILIWSFKKPFAVRKAISMITSWNTDHLKWNQYSK